MHLAVLNASCSVLCVDVEASITRCLLDHVHAKTVLQRHQRAGGCSGLVCTAAADSKQAWCGMLRGLVIAYSRVSCKVHGAALICTQSVVAEGDGLRLSWRMKERGCTATNAAKGSWYCAVVVVSMRLCVSNVSFIYRVAR